MKLTLSREEVERLILENLRIEGIKFGMLKYTFVWHNETVDINYEQVENTKEEPIMFGVPVRRGYGQS